MMKTMLRICFLQKSPSIAAIAVLCLVLCLMLPPRAFAQCENPGTASNAATAVEADEAADVSAMVSAIKKSWSADLTTLRTLMGLTGNNGMGDMFMDKLNWFWGQWGGALKDMTAQLSAGTLDQTKQLSALNDAGNTLSTALEVQKERVAAKARYQPTVQACRFDTTATSMAASREISKALAAGYALDFLKIGNNQKNSIASTGPGGVTKARWPIYQSKFCDGNAENSKNAGCTGTNNATANMDVLPSRTIFSKETIDLAKDDTREAVNQMLFNITGYAAPDPIVLTALPSSTGLPQMQMNREYLAQMDAAGALAYSVVAERAPGTLAPKIKEMRERRGIMDASDKPSSREIRESIVEQLWDPDYYKDLYDNPGTIAQKELYLKAYSLVMLYDLIAKQEKISNAYAIETAIMLNNLSAPVRGSVSGSNGQ
jgi:hypothetical protein